MIFVWSTLIGGLLGVAVVVGLECYTRLRLGRERS